MGEKNAHSLLDGTKLLPHVEEPNTLRLPDGTRVSVIEECTDSHDGKFEKRYVIYRKDKDIFYTEDCRGFGEDIEHHGTPMDKGEIFIRYESTMLQCEVADEDFTDKEFTHDTVNYIKYPHPYTLGDTRARDSFAHEISVYEKLRRHPHPGICEYRGCVVVDGYVESFALKQYRCTLSKAVEQGLSFDNDRVLDTITNAVAHLHSLGFVHNDLSPHNILLDYDLNPVIADMETCMPEGCPAILKLGTPAWSGNWECSTLVHDEIALERLRLYLNGLYNPAKR